MYRLLMLDDVYIVRNNLYKIHWEAEGISSVTYAENFDHLKSAFSVYPYELVILNIDICPSDWEDILAWLNKYYHAAQIILESKQSSFHYTMTALNYDCLFMILPFQTEELMNVLQKAIQRYVKHVREEIPSSEYETIVHYWRYNLTNILQLFWMDIIDQKISPIKSEILKEVERRGIFFLSGGNYSDFISIIISVRSSSKDSAITDPTLLLFALKNLADEILPLSCTKGQSFEIENGILVCLLQIKDNNKYNKKDLLEHLNHYVETCAEFFKCNVHCYTGNPVKCHDISQTINSLLEMCHNYVYNNSGISFLVDYSPSENILIVPPKLNLWGTLLLHGKCMEIISQIYYYFDRLSFETTININVLYQFQHVFNQMVYTILKQTGIRGHYLFSDNETVSLYNTATHSINEMVDWCRHILEKANNAIAEKEKELTLTEKAIKYIRENISSHLTRSTIAGEFYVNADYLGRTFKNDTGRYISQYITELRIDFAKELLSKGKMSVSDVALEVGFSNFSYFSKVFKELTGTLPTDYKSQ